MNAREAAQGMIGVFRLSDTQHPREVWHRGVETAQAWLRLIDSEVLVKAEVIDLAGVMRANGDRSSGWSKMSESFYDWAVEQGVVLLPRAVFFTPLGTRNLGETPEARAMTLLALFEEKSQDDPRSEVWSTGASLARAWHAQLQRPTLSKDEITTFTQHVVRAVHSFLPESVSTALALSVIRWCRTEVNEEAVHAAVELLTTE